MNKLKKYFWNLLISIDQLVNTILLGSPDETISSRLGKWKKLYSKEKNKRYYVAYYICRVLHVLDPDHCEESIEDDEGSRDV